MSRPTFLYRNENGTEISVCKVKEAGGVYLTGQGGTHVVPGDLLVQDGANSWTRITPDELAGYQAVDRGVDDADDEVVVDDPDDFDPGEHRVSEVRDFVARYPDQRERVVQDELNGRNRSGIVNL